MLVASEELTRLSRFIDSLPEEDPLNDQRFGEGFDAGRAVQRIFDETEEKPSDDLEEAANEYGRENVHYWYDEEIGYGAIYDDFEDLKVGFIAGAEWQREQMMKEAVDAEITVGRLPDDWSLSYNPDELHRALLKFKFGDKVKILILKEDGNSEL